MEYGFPWQASNSPVMASANLPIGGPFPAASVTARHAGKVEMVEQLIQDGVTFSANRKLAGLELPVTRRLPALEVLEKLGRQTVYCALPGFAAVPLMALEEVAVLTGRLPAEQARVPELARTVRSLSQEGWSFLYPEGEPLGPLGAYQVLLEQGQVQVGSPHHSALVDAGGLERLHRFARSPALELEAAGLKFFDREGQPGRGLDLFDQPDVRVGLSPPGEPHDLDKLRTSRGLLNGDLKTALELASSLPDFAERPPHAQALTLRRLPSAAARLMAAEQLSREQVLDLAAWLTPPEPDGLWGQDPEPVIRAQRALLERLCQLPAPPPSARLALELAPHLFGQDALQVQKAALEGLEPARVLALPMRCDEEACQKALELACAEPSLGEAVRLGHETAGPQASPVAAWTAFQVALKKPANYPAELLEELRWSRSHDRGRDIELMARNLLAQQGDTPVARLGQALVASLSGEQVGHVVGTLANRAGAADADLGELAIRALPSRAPDACLKAIRPWLDQSDPVASMTSLIERAESLGPAVSIACESVLARFDSADQVLSLLPLLKQPLRAQGDDEPLQAAQVSILMAMARRLQDFPEVTAAAGLGLELARGCEAVSARESLMTVLRAPGTHISLLASQALPWRDASKVEEALAYLEARHPELGDRIASARWAMEGCQAGGTWAVARAWLEPFQPLAPVQMAGRALEIFDQMHFDAREPDESVLVDKLTSALGRCPSLDLFRALAPRATRQQARALMRQCRAEKPHELAALGLSLVQLGAERSLLKAELVKLPAMSSRLEQLDRLVQGLSEPGVWIEGARLVLLPEKLDSQALQAGEQTLLRQLDFERRNGLKFEDGERHQQIRVMLGRLGELSAASEVARLTSAERSGAVQEFGRQVIIGGTTVRRRDVGEQRL